MLIPMTAEIISRENCQARTVMFHTAIGSPLTPTQVNLVSPHYIKKLWPLYVLIPMPD